MVLFFKIHVMSFMILMHTLYVKNRQVNETGKRWKRNLKKKSSIKIKPPSPPPIKEPTPPESTSSSDEEPIAPVIPPAPVIPQAPVIPSSPPAAPAPLSPPKFASLAKNMYPMPNALPSRPVCSDEGRVSNVSQRSSDSQVSGSSRSYSSLQFIGLH